jgi:hypothetical protein
VHCTPCRLLDSCRRGKGRPQLKQRVEHMRRVRRTSLRRHRQSRQTVELKRVRRQLRKEALAWGLSETDLLSLIASLSEAVREQIPGASQFDTKQVVKWIRHPMFPLMLQWIGSSVMNLLSNADTPPSQQEESASKIPPPWTNQAPGAPVPGPRPAMPYSPYGLPGPMYVHKEPPAPGMVAPESVPPNAHFHLY